MPGFVKSLAGLVAVVAWLPMGQATVRWTLGAAGDSCTKACSLLGGNERCIPGYWPRDPIEILRVSVAASNTITCTDVKKAAAGQTYAPYISAGACHYMAQSETVAASCSATPTPASLQRFCPCSPQGVQWLPSVGGQTCMDRCRTHGGVCGDGEAVWPTSAAALANIVAYTPSQTCQNTAAAGQTPVYSVTSSVEYAPYISAAGKCYFPATVSTPFCAAKGTSVDSRFCPCWDIVA